MANIAEHLEAKELDISLGEWIFYIDNNIDIVSNLMLLI